MVRMESYMHAIHACSALIIKSFWRKTTFCKCFALLVYSLYFEVYISLKKSNTIELNTCCHRHKGGCVRARLTKEQERGIKMKKTFSKLFWRSLSTEIDSRSHTWCLILVMSYSETPLRHFFFFQGHFSLFCQGCKTEVTFVWSLHEAL